LKVGALHSNDKSWYSGPGPHVEDPTRHLGEGRKKMPSMVNHFRYRTIAKSSEALGARQHLV
jgi:hypothetical protein